MADNMIKRTQKKPKTELRIAILQRVCPTYRVDLFRKINASSSLSVRLFIGEDLPYSKVVSAKNISDLDVVKLNTKVFYLYRRLLVEHIGLLKALKEYKPDVIIAEGESNFLSLLKSLFYKKLADSVGLIHWSLGGLPGNYSNQNKIQNLIVTWLRKKFDAYITYSTFGKNFLINQGIDPQKIFVAVNVADVSRNFFLAANLNSSQEETRKKLQIPNKFTVLFVGALEKNKRVDVLLRCAELLEADAFNIVIVGKGSEFESLKNDIKKNKISNVILAGIVNQELPLYYQACDIVVLPGRGGMVISEAMSYAVPVIAYEADGTEFDLICNNETGILLNSGSPVDFASAIKNLAAEPNKCKNLGKNAQELVLKKYNMENMVAQIHMAVKYVTDLNKKP